MRARIALVLALAPLAPAGLAQAGTFYFSDTPYLSAQDSPFAPLMESDTHEFWLEDFEDGLLNSLGADAAYTGTILGPGNITDSVDLDGSGVADGSGLDGTSLWVYNDDLPQIIVTFDAGALGQLPTYAGLVWTDGHPEGIVTFEAFDGAGNSLGLISQQLGDDRNFGETEEDRFLGVHFDGGISEITLYRAEGLGGFEIDHLQYGFAAAVVPLPPAVGLGLAGLGLVALRRRRRETA